MSIRLGLAVAIPVAVAGVAAFTVLRGVDSTPLTAPSCFAVASAARAAATAAGEPAPSIGVSPEGVILVFRGYHLLLSSVAHDEAIARELGGSKLGQCDHDGSLRSVWTVPGLPPGFNPPASDVGDGI